MMPSARACWVTRPGRAELRTEELAPPGPEEARVRALYSGISRGTEALVFNGRIPPSQYRSMRAPFQCGDFPHPVKYGYSSVGRVEQGPPEWRGRLVFCLHPHQTAYVVPVQALTPLPATVPPSRGVLAANLETALNGLWDAGPRIGDRIAVIGAGVVGCLTAWLAARIPGCEVELIDIDPARRAVAEALDVPFALPERATPEADLVIHASGAPDGLRTALELAGFEAMILELSWYGDTVVPVPLGEAFHSRRLTLRSSQVGQVASVQRPRWDYRRRLAKVMELLVDPRLDVLIDGESPFETLPEVLPRLAAGGGLCHRIVYD
jgi:NADPH:quinone reductase-like Zn-dependent oxidoreductase